MTDVKNVLQQQLSIAWALLDHHMKGWRDDDVFWEPAPLHWTMHRARGGWAPDFADVEPSPVPAPTIAWLTWHIGWWWSAALAHLEQTDVPAHGDVRWPDTSTAITAWLEGLHEAWRAALSATDRLDDRSAFPWPEEAGLTVADMCAWVNIELMKNAAEIGQLLIIRHARHRPGAEEVGDVLVQDGPVGRLDE
ncbi:DinB family protein [Actinomadura sp. DSM 109109]|nr:DinB family protein [Actinomadura lepetitiana]